MMRSHSPYRELLLLGLIFLAQGGPATSSQCVQPPSGIIAWWSLDEPSGPTAEDRAGNHPGGYSGSPVPTDGQVRGALRFHGLDYLAAADSDLWAFGSSNFTIELWASFDLPGGGTVGHPGDIFIGNDEGPGTLNKWFFALGGGVLNFHINGPGVGSNFLPRVPFSPTVGQWYHLAVTRSGNTFTIFIDGVAGGSDTYTAAIPNPDAPLTIGQAEQLGFMNGRLDEVTIYGRALAEEELKAIFDAGPAGKCSRLTVHPEKGGDTGPVSVSITGTGFAESATVKLVRDHESDIVGDFVTVGGGGTTIAATFDLSEKARGAWDLVVDNLEGLDPTLPQGFTIEEGQAPRLWADIVGLNLIRPGRPQTFWINYGNRGNVDAVAGFLFLSIPAGIEYSMPSGTELKSSPEASVETLMFTKLGPGEVRSVPFTLRVPPSATEVDLGVSIDSSILGTLGLNERYSPAIPGTPRSRTAALMPATSTNSIKASLPQERFLVGSGQQGGTGWIHYFEITALDGSSRETQVGIERSNGDILWSFPGLGVSGSGFIKDNAFNGYQVTHLWGIRPFRGESAMNHFANTLEERVASVLRDGPRPYCNGERSDPKCLSCVGFVQEVMFGDEPTPDDLLVLPTKETIEKEERFGVVLNPGQHYISTDSLMRLLKQYGVVEQLLRTVKGLELLPRARRKLIKIITSFDPNEKTGSQGEGSAQYVSGEEPLRYTILFENLETATASAQEIVITDQLDATKLDLSTLSLGPITFGSHQVVPPSQMSTFSTDVDLRPENDLLVRIEANLNPNTGMLTWRLTSVDPATGEVPEDPAAGFLPPNVNPPEGGGSVLFSVMPKVLPTGSEIRNQASIVFDANAPIMTPEWMNTLDSTAPTSSVLPLSPVQGSADFTVRWSGADEGSGLREYTVYVSEEKGPFLLWLGSTEDTSAVFHGEQGKAYAFYTVARDRTGNPEHSPAGADASTQVGPSGIFFDGFESGDVSAWSSAVGSR